MIQQTMHLIVISIRSSSIDRKGLTCWRLNQTSRFLLSISLIQLVSKLIYDNPCVTLEPGGVGSTYPNLGTDRAARRSS